MGKFASAYIYRSAPAESTKRSRLLLLFISFPLVALSAGVMFWRGSDVIKLVLCGCSRIEGFLRAADITSEKRKLKGSRRRFQLYNAIWGEIDTSAAERWGQHALILFQNNSAADLVFPA